MKKYRGLIIGFIAGAIFATATGASAAVGDQVEAVFAQFNFIINGKSVTLDETPLVYNGTSYLPVRSLSNALGLDVTYKADSRTIVLSKGDSVTGGTYGPTPTPSPTTSVVSPAPTSGNVESGSTTTTVGGNKDMSLETIVNYVTGEAPAVKANDVIYLQIRAGSKKYGVDISKWDVQRGDNVIKYEGKSASVPISQTYTDDCDAFYYQEMVYMKEDLYSQFK